MTALNEVILSTLPGSSETERLLLVLRNDANLPAGIELRQQSFAAGLGWFTQSTVALEPSQVAALRLALGTGAAGAQQEVLPKSFRRVTPPAWQPRVVRADSA